MGTPSLHPPVLFLIVAFSRHEEALAWGLRRAVERYGPLVAESEPFPFDNTSYYERDMGPNLFKRVWAFEQLMPPEELVERKLQTNAWEAELAATGLFPDARPLNLDAGYLTIAKFVLATTKDHAHRIYLGQGIFAEVTLLLNHKHWQAWPWTFEDYRREPIQNFLWQCRQWLRQRTEDTHVS